MEPGAPPVVVGWLPRLHRNLETAADMRPAALLAAVLLSAAPSAAYAGDCATPYTANMASEDLGSMTVALRNLDEAAFAQAGARMDGGLPCLTEPLPVTAMASAFRFLGAYHYLNGDKDTGSRWFRTALEVDPGFTWDVNDLPQGHPIREAFDGERAIAAQPALTVDGMVLDSPSGTVIYMDGRPLESAAATSGRPHLVQLLDDELTVVKEGWLINGNELPDSLLITQAEADARAAAALASDATDKKKKKSKGDSQLTTVASATDPYAVQTVRRTRPRAKTPLLVTGAVGVVASGVIYGLSFPAHQRFTEATTTDELLEAQAATNTLVIASGATLAVGMGIGIVGIQLDSSGGGLLLGSRF